MSLFLSLPKQKYEELKFFWKEMWYAKRLALKKLFKTQGTLKFLEVIIKYYKQDQLE